MNSVHEQCPKSDSETVLSQKLAKCTMCTATAQPARTGHAQAAHVWACHGQPSAVSQRRAPAAPVPRACAPARLGPARPTLLRPTPPAPPTCLRGVPRVPLHAKHPCAPSAPACPAPSAQRPAFPPLACYKTISLGSSPIQFCTKKKFSFFFSHFHQ